MFKSSITFISIAFIFGLTWNVSINYNIVVFAPMLILIIMDPSRFSYLRKEYLFVIFTFLLLFLLWAVLNIVLHDNYDPLEVDRFVKVFILGLIIMVFTFLFYGEDKKLLLTSIDYALWAMVLLWWMQLIAFYTTGEYIDLLQLAGSVREQRYQAYWVKSAFPIDLIRPTSIFIEPGTYAVNTFPLLVLSYLQHNRMTKLHILIILSYFGTMSLFAIIIGVLFIVLSQLAQFKFKLSIKNIFFILLLLLMFFGVEQYLIFRFVEEGGTDQVGYRETIISYWFSLSGEEILMGVGAAQSIFAKSMVEDASFIFKLIFDYGVFSLPYIIVMAYLSRGIALLFFFIILLSKVHYQIYIMWFYAAALTILWSVQINVRSQKS